MKVKYTAPTENFPFYSNVSVETSNGFKLIKEYPSDGRPSGPALFACKDEMKSAALRLARKARNDAPTER